MYETINKKKCCQYFIFHVFSLMAGDQGAPSGAGSTAGATNGGAASGVASNSNATAGAVASVPGSTMKIKSYIVSFSL